MIYFCGKFLRLDQGRNQNKLTEVDTKELFTRGITTCFARTTCKGNLRIEAGGMVNADIEAKRRTCTNVTTTILVL